MIRLDDGFYMQNRTDKVYITHHALKRFITRCKPSYVNLGGIGKKTLTKVKDELFSRVIDALNYGLPHKERGGYNVTHKGVEFVVKFPEDFVKLVTVISQNNNNCNVFKQNYRGKQ